MNDLKKVFNGADEFLDEVIILPVGSHNAGSYNLPGGYSWTDFESIEMGIAYENTPDALLTTTTLTKELIANNPVSWNTRLTHWTELQVTVNATGVSAFLITLTTGTTGRVTHMKGYIKRYGTRNLSKTISVNGGATISVGSRHEIDIATELGADYLNRDLVVTVEIYNNSGDGVAGWGEPGMVVTRGVGASVLGGKIVVQAGLEALCDNSTSSGSPFNNTADIISPAPCRVKVWKVDQYLPSTQSSGDITTIWTGDAGQAVTVDWSGTSYILSQFDAVLLKGTRNGTIVTAVVRPEDILAIGKAVVHSGTVNTSNIISLDVNQVTETSLYVDVTSLGYVGIFTGIYGINYK